MQVYPCALSVSVYHFFQLTELSTMFLHMNWMLSKAQVQYFYLYLCTTMLLLTFVQRIVTCAFIVVHTVFKIRAMALWQVRPPGQGQSAAMRAHAHR
jgi:hypothetical protein